MFIEDYAGFLFFQVHIRISSYQCGGVLLNHWYVATAAHCVHQAKLEKITVHLGEFDTKNNERVMAHVIHMSSPPADSLFAQYHLLPSSPKHCTYTTKEGLFFQQAQCIVELSSAHGVTYLFCVKIGLQRDIRCVKKQSQLLSLSE